MTGNTDVVDRLASLPSLSEIPRPELEWLVEHGTFETREAGFVAAEKGKPVDKLWVLLSGSIAVWVDHGVGPRRVMVWRTGDVTGMLPFSRMKAPPGNNLLEERSEALTVHERHFPEMIRTCPAFTAYTVHLMLDRARSFNSSALQDEKMMSLGRLSAGLAHELNNPASATARAAKQLLEHLTEADAAARALGEAGLTAEQLGLLERFRSGCAAHPADALLSPMQLVDREDELASWLEGHSLDPAHAEPLAATAVSTDDLVSLAQGLPGGALNAAVRWVAAGCTTHTLARDIDQAASRIHELVAAVKRFTYMDNLDTPEPVDVGAGIRDTLRVLASKAKGKGATITLDVDPELPRVDATGSELNQVWLNLMDNALDAIPESGHIEISARVELDRVVVRVVDDGPGIPRDVVPRIFDPFFTTKAPGQGTGLGLDITQRLVRRYHGEVAVESRPGRTEFRVTLNPEG